MNPWSDFLHTENKGFSAESDTQLCPITNKSALAVTGRDSKKFLQGQLSCDIDQVSPSNWRRGAHCNHKGRVIFDFMATQSNAEGVLLFCQQSASETALNSLKKYIVFSKAEALIDSELHTFGVNGPAAESLLSNTAIGPTAFSAVNYQGGFILRLAPERFECWLPLDAAKNLWQQLKPSCQLAAENHWQLLDIQAGIGAVSQQTVEMFIPQMLNLNELDGINYQKGCYTGQEIIARMQYRGNLKRHMYRLSICQESVPSPGCEIFIPQKNQSIGNVVSVVDDGERLQLLAVCTDTSIIEGALYLKANKEQNFQAESLPYAITNA